MMTIKRRASAIAAALALAAAAGQARAQTYDFYVGQLQQFATNWCPQDWARADGSLLSIAQNSPLYSLLGTTFGGDGVVTFGLPDLRERAPIGYSTTNPLGAVIGQSSVTLTVATMPSHSHTFSADPTGPVGPNPSGAMLGLFPSGQTIYAASSATPTVAMRATMLTPVGSNFPMSTQSPVLATNWCIALTGIYPSHP